MSCLPPSNGPKFFGTFHCPSCKERHWDRDPPQVTTSTPVSEISRSSTTSGRNGDMVSSPSSRTGNISEQESPDIGSGMTPLPAYQTLTRSRPQSALDNDHQLTAATGISYQPGAMSLDDEATDRARLFLTEYGGFHPNQGYRQELLLNLGQMIKRLEMQEARLSEVQSVQEENAWLRRERSQLQHRAYHNLGPRFPSSEAWRVGSSGTSSPIPRPTLDTAGKSWDSIVMDLY